MRAMLAIFLLPILWGWYGEYADDAWRPRPPAGLAGLTVDQSQVHNAAALIRRASLVAEAETEGTPALQADTGRKVSGRKLMHYGQKLRVKRVLKGVPPASLTLVTSGVEPLPPAHDPLNRTYTGPLADRVTYVLFLQPTTRPGHYTLVGGWQAVYPLDTEGRTIALSQSGFPELAGKKPMELAKLMQPGP